LLLGVIGVFLLINFVIFFIKRLRSRYVKREVAKVARESLFLANCLTYGLSGRETEVLRLILEGLTYKEVGERLFISGKTVDSHMQRIYEKVGVRNKFALLHKMYK
jgi:DNA-binding CsgD family transcriptional regulator